MGKKLDPDKGELQVANLYLKVKATDNVFTVLGGGQKEFLKEGTFEVKAAVVVQNIYHDGTISKEDYTDMKKVDFIYHDKNLSKHLLGKFKIFWAQKWKAGTKFDKSGNAEWKKVVSAGIIRYYKYDKEKLTPLINPYSSSLGKNKFFSYNLNDVTIKLYENTSREYHNPIAISTIFGALADVGYKDVVCNGSVGIDATGAYSVTHFNGGNTDFKFLRKDKKKGKIDKDSNGNLFPAILSNDNNLDIERQNKFINALYKFGWGRTEKNLANITSQKNNLNHCKEDKHHWNHLHIQGFKPNFKNK